MDFVAGQIMTPKPEHVEVNASLREAISKMREMNIRHLPVLFDGELVGMVSDRDILSIPFANLEAGTPKIDTEKSFDASVSSIMSGGVVSINTETPLHEIIDLMLEYKVGALPVLDPETGDLRGIVSYIDILKATNQLLEESAS